jgi:hypothetical protein
MTQGVNVVRQYQLCNEARRQLRRAARAEYPRPPFSDRDIVFFGGCIVAVGMFILMADIASSIAMGR